MFAIASFRAAIVEWPVKLEIFVSRFCQSLHRLAEQFMSWSWYGMHASSVTPVLLREREARCQAPAAAASATAELQ
jgi:hypothetical protein